MNTLEARRIDKNTYDIFQGKGWDNWVRVRQGHNGTYRVMGEKVDHSTLKELDTILAPNMPITYGQDMHTMLRNNQAIQ
jgi:hypothetical protein